MPEPFMMAKAVDMSGAALGKATSVVLKGLLVIGLIALFAWMCYVTFVKPHTNPLASTEQNAEQINNEYYYPNKRVFGFGITIWGLDIGVYKYSYPPQTIKTTKTTVEAAAAPAVTIVQPKKKHWYFLWLA